MKIGITGHQKRPGLDWNWAREQTELIVEGIPTLTAGYSSLAEGADQLFARVLLDMHVRVFAVIPIANYEKFFDAAALGPYHELLTRCIPLEMPVGKEPERAFYDAGCLIVDEVDLMIAIWDQEHSHGFGGTADIVRYAGAREKPMMIINPVRRTVEGQTVSSRS